MSQQTLSLLIPDPPEQDSQDLLAEVDILATEKKCVEEEEDSLCEQEIASLELDRKEKIKFLTSQTFVKNENLSDHDNARLEMDREQKIQFWKNKTFGQAKVRRPAGNSQEKEGEDEVDKKELTRDCPNFVVLGKKPVLVPYQSTPPDSDDEIDCEDPHCKHPYCRGARSDEEFYQGLVQFEEERDREAAKFESPEAYQLHRKNQFKEQLRQRNQFDPLERSVDPPTPPKAKKTFAKCISPS